MTDDASPENLRKFLESDDPAMRRMGLSLAKGSGVPEELLGLVAGLYMWHDDKGVRAAAKSAFMKHAPDDVKKVVLETWKTSYRTMKTGEALQPKVKAMLPGFKDTLLDTVDVWKPALVRTSGDKVSIVRIMDGFGAEAVKPLIRALGDDDRGSGWTSVGAYATGALGVIGKPAVEPLIKALEDDASDVRAHAAWPLGEIGDERAVEALIGVLSDDASDVREAAAWALGKIGDARAVEPLIEALEDDDRGVRNAAAWALGIGDERAVKPLIKALEDENESVRAHAAWALGEIGDARAVEPLIKALGVEDWHVHKYAAEALKMFGVQGLQGFITAGKGEELTVPELKTILKENGLSVSGAKAQLIQRLTKFKANAKKSTEKITEKDPEKLLKSENTAMIQKGLSMVKKDGVPEELLPTVLGLYMWDDDENVRAAAKSVFTKYAPAEIQAKVKETWKPSYRTLSISGDKFLETIRPFVQAFKSQDEFVEIALEPLIKALEEGKSFAAKALGEISDAHAVEPLIAALRDDESDVRRCATEALGAIGDVRAVEPLIGLLCGSSTWIEGDWVVRINAAEALGGIGGERAVEALIEAFGDEHSDVRRAAAWALRKIGKPAVEPLIKALEDENNEDRAIAAEALGKIGDARAVEPLIEALEDDDRGVRSSAASVLGWFDTGSSVRAVEPLIKALGDEDYWVRWRAAGALGTIGDERAVEPLIKALEDEEEYVRRNAAKALKMLGVQGLQGFITAGKENELKVPELKMILKEKKLPLSGTKGQLIQRLKEVE